MNPTSAVNLTEAAARHINKIVIERKNAGLLLRLAVQGGGCSGFEYKFDFDTHRDPAEDILIERDGARLVVDKTSLEYVAGAEVDFYENLMESGFRIQNPNAASSCGCGASFAVKDS